MPVVFKTSRVNPFVLKREVELPEAFQRWYISYENFPCTVKDVPTVLLLRGEILGFCSYVSDQSLEHLITLSML